jgi:hypothetical protein
VHAYPDAARRLVSWDERHTEQAREFVTWTVTQPGGGIEAFLASHPKGQFLSDVGERHMLAADAFMAWCRRHPEAATELVSHPRGLEWVGRHLYRV